MPPSVDALWCLICLKNRLRKRYGDVTNIKLESHVYIMLMNTDIKEGPSYDG